MARILEELVVVEDHFTAPDRRGVVEDDGSLRQSRSLFVVVGGGSDGGGPAAHLATMPEEEEEEERRKRLGLEKRRSSRSLFVRGGGNDEKKMEVLLPPPPSSSSAALLGDDGDRPPCEEEEKEEEKVNVPVVISCVAHTCVLVLGLMALLRFRNICQIGFWWGSTTASCTYDANDGAVNNNVTCITSDGGAGLRSQADSNAEAVSNAIGGVLAKDSEQKLQLAFDDDIFGGSAAVRNALSCYNAFGPIVWVAGVYGGLLLGRTRHFPQFFGAFWTVNLLWLALGVAFPCSQPAGNVFESAAFATGWGQDDTVAGGFPNLPVLWALLVGGNLIWHTTRTSSSAPRRYRLLLASSLLAFVAALAHLFLTLACASLSGRLWNFDAVFNATPLVSSAVFMNAHPPWRYFYRRCIQNKGRRVFAVFHAVLAFGCYVLFKCAGSVVVRGVWRDGLEAEATSNARAFADAAGDGAECIFRDFVVGLTNGAARDALYVYGVVAPLGSITGVYMWILLTRTPAKFRALFNGVWGVHLVLAVLQVSFPVMPPNDDDGNGCADVFNNGQSAPVRLEDASFFNNPMASFPAVPLIHSCMASAVVFWNLFKPLKERRGVSYIVWIYLAAALHPLLTLASVALRAGHWVLDFLLVGAALVVFGCAKAFVSFSSSSEERTTRRASSLSSLVAKLLLLRLEPPSRRGGPPPLVHRAREANAEMRLEMAHLGSQVSLPAPAPPTKIEVSFPKGPMGMRLMDVDGRALVSELRHGSVAEAKGILVGDTLVAVAGQATDSYFAAVDISSTAARPVVMTFERRDIFHSMIERRQARESPTTTSSPIVSDERPPPRRSNAAAAMAAVDVDDDHRHQRPQQHHETTTTAEEKLAEIRITCTVCGKGFLLDDLNEHSASCAAIDEEYHDSSSGDDERPTTKKPGRGRGDGLVGGHSNKKERSAGGGGRPPVHHRRPGGKKVSWSTKAAEKKGGERPPLQRKTIERKISREDSLKLFVHGMRITGPEKRHFRSVFDEMAKGTTRIEIDADLRDTIVDIAGISDAHLMEYLQEMDKLHAEEEDGGGGDDDDDDDDSSSDEDEGKMLYKVFRATEGGSINFTEFLQLLVFCHVIAEATGGSGGVTTTSRALNPFACSYM